MLNRRTWLAGAAGVLTSQIQGDQPSLPIIDTHIHMFDPTRPEGIPWPPKTDRVLYKPALPARYRSLTAKLGVVGAVVVEASPWLEDNEWVLDLAKDNPIIVGFVGDLEPDKPDFRRQFDRFHRNPLFRGIRYGNLWGRDLGTSLNNPVFVEGLKLIADAGLEMDTANPDPKLIHTIVQLTDKIPSLRVVVDHLPGLKVPTDQAARQKYEADLRELGKRPQVYVKISQVPQRVDGAVSFELAHYRPLLDHLWETFGADRLLYGSDWPNSDPWGRYDQILALVRSYFAEKGADASEKYFWKNSIAAYRWVKRNSNQPPLPA